MNAIYMHSRDNIKDKPKLTDDQRRLVEENVRLAYIFAKRYPIPLMSREDNLAEALFCLCRAAHGFRPELGFHFSTFAATYHKNWIRAGWRLYSAKHKGAGVGFTRFHHEDQADCEPEDKGPRPGEILEAQEEIDRKLEVLAVLDERSQEVIKRRSQGKKLKAIGDSLGITRERVRQLHAKAMAKLGFVIGVKKAGEASYAAMIAHQKQKLWIFREKWKLKLKQMRRLSIEHPEWNSIRLARETGISDRICRKYMHRSK